MYPHPGDQWTPNTPPQPDPEVRQLPEAEPEPPVQTPVEDMQAEVDAEEAEPLPEIPEGAFAVPLCGQIVHIIDPATWFSSANDSLQVGDFEGWAEDCLVEGEYESVWCQVNDGRGPRLNEILDMMDEFQRVSGQTTGKSRALRRLSRRMQRR